MLSIEQARVLAAKWFRGADGVELAQDGEFWRAWRPGRTSINVFIGPDGGVLVNHIAQRTDEQAKADYLKGVRSEFPDPSKVPPVVQPSEEEIKETKSKLDSARLRIKKLLSKYLPKSE